MFIYIIKSRIYLSRVMCKLDPAIAVYKVPLVCPVTVLSIYVGLINAQNTWLVKLVTGQYFIETQLH